MVWLGCEFDKFLDEAKDTKLLQTTHSFYESAMKSDIFGKVDFVEEKQQMKKADGVPF